MSKPSDGMELDELRDEFDWMFEFQSHIAERIMGDSDVHNHVEYVRKLEAENTKLRELAKYAILCSEGDIRCVACPYHETSDGCIVCNIHSAANGLGIEVTA